MLRSVSVKGLFGQFDYRLELDGPLIFIHSPNGFGKSTLMQMVVAVIGHDSDYLSGIPFGSISLDYGDSCISAERTAGGISFDGDWSGKKALSIPADRLYLHQGDHIVPALVLYSERMADADPGRMSIYLETVNGILMNKSVVFDGRLKCRFPDGTEMDVSRMSSGEKHILAMFYTLVFESEPGSLAVIDEPEISLHVMWQQGLGDIFLELCHSLKIQMIVATHSPQVIHDKWSMARELGSRDARNANF